MKDPLFGIVSLLEIVIALIVGFFIGHTTHRTASVEPPASVVDTLYIRDTIKVTEAVSVTRRVVDSVPYPVADTIRMKDTLYVYLEREQVKWEDSLSTVYASGIDPKVDSVVHYVQGQVIIQERIKAQRCRWGLGVQAGMGVCKDGITPYVGVGVSYNILSW